MRQRAESLRKRVAGIGIAISRYAYPALLLLWLIAFGLETVLAALWAASIARANDQFESRAAALERAASETNGLIRRIRSLARELEFLQGLPNIMPQDKGYLRTQKVIAEEVQALRLKVGQRLKGSLHILVDAKANKLYFKKGMTFLWEADCSVGRGGILMDKRTGRRWEFVTPRGEFRVLGKSENPIWLKPDWAFVESKEAIPPPDAPERKVEGELGAYVLNLGDGYLIHGTKNENLLGRPVSHGCVRLGTENLKKLYETVPVGTKVYIY